MKKILIVLILTITTNIFFAQSSISQFPSRIGGTKISQSLTPLPAAYRTQVYLPLLKGKRVGIFANQTATIGNKHLVDTLLALGIKITKAFGPEHGFRGIADAGEKVENYIDLSTGIPVISLYGKKKKAHSSGPCRYRYPVV